MTCTPRSESVLLVSQAAPGDAQQGDTVAVELVDDIDVVCVVGRADALRQCTDAGYEHDGVTKEGVKALHK
jgi:hypothetical protein